MQENITGDKNKIKRNTDATKTNQQNQLLSVCELLLCLHASRKVNQRGAVLPLLPSTEAGSVCFRDAHGVAV